MKPTLKTLIIIPARGGSKGIPRKNLRPLNGKPLLSYVIATCKASRHQPDVYVSSEDAEILFLATRHGALTHQRNPALADDRTTLDPVILSAWKEIEELHHVQYDVIITVQPTAPLLSTETLDLAIDRFLKLHTVDCLLSARRVAHLSWKKQGEDYIPNFTKRVNRQELEPQYFETGAFFINRRESLLRNNQRVAGNVQVYEIPDKEAIDIDTAEDWNVCEFLLSRKKILFVVTGNNKVGMGHVFRSLLIGNELIGHKLDFLVDAQSELAYQVIASKNYHVHQAKDEPLSSVIAQLEPDLVINDILDTDEKYIRALRSLGIKVINFEDLGSGARYADAVFNALYPEKMVLPKHYFGHKYFLAREEFFDAPLKRVSGPAKHVLLTFGGTDPADLSHKVLKAIYPHTRRLGIQVQVIFGIGYAGTLQTIDYPEVEFFHNIPDMSVHMSWADLIFTSAGRTVYEIACIGTPAIVLCQNERELTHFFASVMNGFINMGLGSQVSSEEIAEQFVSLVEDEEQRKQMNLLMLSQDVRSGKSRVLGIIDKIIRGVTE